MTLLCGILFVLLGLSTDSAPSLLRSRSPPSSVTGLSNFPSSFEGYKYVIMKFGPLQLTTKALSAASTAACLTFTVSFPGYLDQVEFVVYICSVVYIVE